MGKGNGGGVGNDGEDGDMETGSITEWKKCSGKQMGILKEKDEKENTVQFKAQLIAQGFSQKPGLDYNDLNTYTPVVHYESLRTLLAMATQHGWHLNQYDVKNACLNGEIDEEIYMQQPPGFDGGSGRMCWLLKCIYRLVQAGNV